MASITLDGEKDSKADGDPASSGGPPSAVPSSKPDEDSVPLSARDLELEPVSFQEIEQILAPGKTPPKLADSKTAKAKPTTAQDDAARKRIPAVPKRADRTKGADGSDLKSDSATIDLRVLTATAAPTKRALDTELASLTMAPAVSAAAPLDLAPPEPAKATTTPRPQDGRAKPPIKKREPRVPDATLEEPFAERSEPERERPKSPAATKAISSRPPPRFEPPSFTAEPPRAVSEAPSARPRPLDVAALRASAPPPPDTAPASSRKIILALAGAGLLGLGFFLGRMTVSAPTADARPAATQAAPTTATNAAPTSTSATTDAPPETAEEAQPVAAETAAPVATHGSNGSSTSSKGSGTATTKATAETAPTSTPTHAATAAPTAAPAAVGPFDPKAASAALQSAMGSASACRQDGDPSGMAQVSITFAPSGRVTRSTISGPPFQGTPTGGCIARAFKAASVPPFEGGPTIVTKTVNIR
ncbi:MAG: hypothetical protein HOW73_02905 [Polyangiaceae bacterium]|nr:hypothetical protein [Polyangiaceae bacterium]